MYVKAISTVAPAYSSPVAMLLLAGKLCASQALRTAELMLGWTSFAYIKASYKATSEARKTPEQRLPGLAAFYVAVIDVAAEPGLWVSQQL